MHIKHIGYTVSRCGPLLRFPLATWSLSRPWGRGPPGALVYHTFSMHRAGRAPYHHRGTPAEATPAELLSGVAPRRTFGPKRDEPSRVVRP